MGEWDGSLHRDMGRLGNFPAQTQKETGGTTLPPVNLLPKTGKTNRIYAVKSPVCYSKNPQFADAPFPL